jgi:hypothetical protein
MGLRPHHDATSRQNLSLDLNVEWGDHPIGLLPLRGHLDVVHGGRALPETKRYEPILCRLK